MGAQEQCLQGGATLLSLRIRDIATLGSLFIPFLVNGGLFIPTNKLLKPGDNVFLLLQLPDEEEKRAITGTVVWITPPGSQYGCKSGYGVHFGVENQALLKKIADCLEQSKGQNSPSHIFNFARV